MLETPPGRNSITQMAAYDDFAWFYDRYWNQEFHSLAMPLLERIWLSRLPARARILDLCCGTGYLGGLLAGRGYRITGIDVSAEMIRHARANVPTAEFHVADVSTFRPRGRFDAAVSTFDSLNHILQPDSFAAAIRNTAAVLRPGGLFVFDMLLEEAYLTHWGESFALVREDHVLTITGAGFDFRSRLAECRITMFRLIDGTWRRSDTVVEERCYSREEIDSALASAGFGEIVCHAASDLAMAGQLGEGRVFFVAKRLEGGGPRR
jgi:SAM-dependent methyltransferase